MKHINEELEGNVPAWDSNLRRWIEPDEVLDNPEPESNNATNETRAVLTVDSRKRIDAEIKKLEVRDIMKRRIQELEEGLRTAADWMSRSTRIDDQEQAADAREILNKGETTLI